MITTIYRCDKCAKEQDNPDQMWSIEVRFTNMQYPSSYEQAKMSAHWCRECAERAGFLPVRIVRAEEVVPPTLEDLIRDIVRQEVVREG